MLAVKDGREKCLANLLFARYAHGRKSHVGYNENTMESIGMEEVI